MRSFSNSVSAIFLTITALCATPSFAYDATKNIIPTISLLLNQPKCPPGSVEFPGNNIGDDCDGIIDESSSVCDSSLSLDSTNPMDAAFSIELCQQTQGNEWGVVNAFYERADGSNIKLSQNIQHGLQSSYGYAINPLSGYKMLHLSTGSARTIGQIGYGSDSSFGGPGVAPEGFPQNVPGCVDGTGINDDIVFTITIRSPPNVTGFQFYYLFTTPEYPNWICTPYNDQFIVQMDPAPPGAINGNVSFDAFTRPISVNAAYFPYCNYLTLGDYGASCTDNCPPPPSPYCPLGISDLTGTGCGINEWSAEGGGSTGWYRTQVPVQPGQEFTLKFMIWDTSDTIYDSSVIIDNFSWLTGNITLNTEPGHEFNPTVGQCEKDCNDDWCGSAYLDNCNTCVGGNTGVYPCVQDCNSDWGGTAYLDVCGFCVSGNTGKTDCLASPPQKRVFISSVAYDGNLGGLAGADQKCNDLASSAGLTGQYKAWLSDSTASPSTRFNHYDETYGLLDGKIIAINWSDLTDGSLLEKITIDENGNPESTWVWTGTKKDGTANTYNCSDWNSNSGVERGSIGYSYWTDLWWTDDNLSYCNSTSRLYCFEQ